MMENGAVELKEGATTVVTIDDVLGTAERFGTLYKLLPKDVKQGDLILLVFAVTPVDAGGCAELAKAYKDGKGVAVDLTKSDASFTRACSLGLDDKRFDITKIAGVPAPGQLVRRSRHRQAFG